MSNDTIHDTTLQYNNTKDWSTTWQPRAEGHRRWLQKEQDTSLTKKAYEYIVYTIIEAYIDLQWFHYLLSKNTSVTEIIVAASYWIDSQ